MVLRKKPLQKRANNQKISRFEDLAKMATLERLYSLQNGQFGSKIRIAKNMGKTPVRAQ